MQYHALEVSQALAHLHARPEGLSDKQVQLRRNQYGYNEIPQASRESLLLMFLKQFNSLLVFVLVGAAAISWITGHQVDTYVILAVIIINATIGFSQDLRAANAVAALKSLLVPSAKVLRNGQRITLPARELVPGDIIILEEGDSIPADGRLIESKNLRAIEAPLTGESVPVEKSVEPLPVDTPLADRRNMLYKGTFIAAGFGKAVVTATGINTAIGEIALTLSQIKPEKTNFQKKTDALAKQMALIAIFSAILLFCIAYFYQKTPLDEVLLVAIAALVSSIPAGLPAVLAIVLAIGANRMAKRNAIIREFTATETLGSVTTIITDKTGTLTQNTLTVCKVLVPNMPEWQVTGQGWSPIGNFMHGQTVVEPREIPLLRQLLIICGWSNNSDIQHDKEKNVYRLVGDPTEGALLVLAHKGGFFPGHDPSIEKIDDLPFNSNMKMRATLVNNQGKKQLLVVGAPEKVLARSTFLATPEGILPLNEAWMHQLKQQIDAWSMEAMRVLALAWREEPFQTQRIDEQEINNLIFAGMVGMIDPPRPEVNQAVAACKQAGIRVIMATGDHINTALAIARATGIIDSHTPHQALALTEQQLLALDEKEFEQAVYTTNVFARLTPGMKLRIAETLQRRGELIAMTGDGVNDAPALKKADVGVAMGIMGTDVAREAAKVVLADDNFSTIVSAVEEGRIVFINARQTSFYLLTTNFAEIITLVVSILSGLPVPLTATQILWMNLVTDGVSDIALATEAGHGQVLKQKPIDPKENILNAEVLPFLLINASLMTLLTIIAFKWFMTEGIEKARSAAFVIMAFCQIYNVINMRSLKLSIFQIGLFTNSYINVALLISIAVQIAIIEVPFLAKMFHFQPIPADEFISLVLAASGIFWLGEIYKFIRYRLIESDE
ncbi:MAG: HAD-IC family P-type ATPase [Cytophagales bacterium]|nr:HAD-IC family P-type ATPase [Bernardetiaceae bacterium]MDW8211564.1 HAD-IC family P-type ATPase [Cytophagales bacterium]